MRASDVRPITDLKSRAKQLVDEVHASGKTVVITRNGKPRSVLMDVEVYDRLQATLAMLKILARSQESLSRGRPRTTSEVRTAARAAMRNARQHG